MTSSSLSSPFLFLRTTGWAVAIPIFNAEMLNDFVLLQGIA